MPPFVSPSRKAAKRIPVITLGELIDALSEYLPAILPIEIGHITYNWDTTWVQTTLSFRHKKDNSKGISVTIDDKAAKSLTSRLWPHPFSVHVQPFMLGEKHFFLWVTPLEERSIEIRRIVRWENGVPFVESDDE